MDVVIVGDGTRWIRRVAEERFPTAVHIVDCSHAQEQVWNVANTIEEPTTPQGAVRAKPVDELLSRGKMEERIARMSHLLAIPVEPGASRSIPDIEADSFRTNAERMCSPTFRARGIQSGSGVAEAACTTVVSTRATRSGMRWTPDGLDAVLNRSSDFFRDHSQQLPAA